MRKTTPMLKHKINMILDGLSIINTFTPIYHKKRSQAKYLANTAISTSNAKFKQNKALKITNSIFKKKCHTKSVTSNVTLPCEKLYPSKSKLISYVPRILISNNKNNLHKLLLK